MSKNYVSFDDMKQLLGQLNKSLNGSLETKAIFDIAHPIGETYVQYPWNKDPETLYNRNGIESKWELIDYDGAFFRAEGGKAAQFQETKEIQKYYSWPILDHEIFLSTIAIARSNALTHYSDEPYDEDDFHIKRIERKDGNYTVEVMNGRTYECTGDTHIYNFDNDIGTLDHLFSQDWTKELIQETIFDSSIPLANRNFAVVAGAAPSDNNKVAAMKPYAYTSEREMEAGTPAGLNMAQVYKADKSVQLINPRNTLVYADNISAGHMEGQWTPWLADKVESDVMYAYPPIEPDTVYSIANKTNPTDAEVIVKVEKLREQDYYSIVFADGHSANYIGTTVFYKVGPDWLNDNAMVRTLISQNMGQLRGLYDTWKESSAYWRWFTFPDNDKCCYTTSTSTTPTDANIVVAAELPPRTDYNGGLLHFKDGHIAFYTYKDASIYRVDKAAGKNKYIGTMGIFMLFDNDHWTGEERTDTVYIPNESEELVLSTVSAAAPTAAQQVRCVHFDVVSTLPNLNADYKDYCYVCNNDGSATVYQNPNKVSLYNKNTLYGSINVLRLRWTEGTYKYIDEITEELKHYTKYTPDQPLFLNGNSVIDVRYDPNVNGAWIIRCASMSDAAEIIATKVANQYTGITLTDEDGAAYQWTVQSCNFNAIVARESNTVYYPPKSGNWYYNSIMQQFLWNTTNTDTYININNNIHDGIDWEAHEHYTTGENPSSTKWNNALLHSISIIPGTDKAVMIRKDGSLTTSADVSGNMHAGRSAAEISAFGVKMFVEEIESHWEPVPAWVPPEHGRDGTQYVASNTSVAAPNVNQQVEYIARGYNDRLITMMATSGWYSGLKMPDLHVYDRNITDSFATLHAGHDWRIDAEDIDCFYPPEQDWFGDEYVASIASNANPNDAQRIVKIDPLEGSTNYNVIFADGHSAVYPQTQAVYNRNKYYTTIYGILVALEQQRATSQSQMDCPPEPSTYSTAKSLPSLPANEVERVRWLEGTSIYLLYMKDGSYKSVNHDAIIYDITDEASIAQRYVREAFVVNWSDEGVCYQEESMPDIRGVFPATKVTYGGAPVSGVFRSLYKATNSIGGSGLGTEHNNIAFKASYTNNAYGRRPEMAPNNYTIRVWERVMKYSKAELKRRANVAGTDMEVK